MDIKHYRQQEYEANEIFMNRWSPRSLKPELIPEEELMKLFEAAKWAPSSFNSQPWRFIYTTRDSVDWEDYLDLLVDFNKSWAKNASALIILVSRKNFEYNEEPSTTHSFDTGAAWQNLALQASMQGLVAHGIGGFNHEKAKKTINITKEYHVEAMIVIGKQASKENLPVHLQDKEKPNARKKLKEIVFKGKMN